MSHLSPPLHPHPIGLIAGADQGPRVLARLAAGCERIVVAGSAPDGRAAWATGVARSETVATRFEVGAECETVVAAISTEALIEAFLGTPDRLGFGPALRPGSIVVHLDALSLAASHAAGPATEGPDGSAFTNAKEARGLAGMMGGHGIGYVDAVVVDFTPDGHAEAAPGGARPWPSLVCASGWPEFVETVTPVLALLGSVARAAPAAGGAGVVAAQVHAARARQWQAVRAARARLATMGFADAVLDRALPWPCPAPVRASD